MSAEVIQPVTTHFRQTVPWQVTACERRTTVWGCGCSSSQTRFVFAGLFVARFYLYGAATRPEVDQFVGLAVTVMLLAQQLFCQPRREFDGLSAT